MNWLKRVFGAGHSPSAHASETDFVARCFMWVEVVSDDREWRQIEAARVIPTLSYSDLDQASDKAKELIASLPDFYFGYYWSSVIQRRQGHFEAARTIGSDGLKNARRKYDLCEALAQTEYDAANISEAVMWWIRALRLRIALRAFNDTSTIVYLSSIADDLRIPTLSRRMQMLATPEMALSADASAKLTGLLAKTDRQQCHAALTRLLGELSATPARAN